MWLEFVSFSAVDKPHPKLRNSRFEKKKINK